MVSPTIHNLKVATVLVDVGAGLNLISPAVIKRLQIPDGDLEEMGTSQGVNLGRSQPKGKITLPVTFGGELNYRTEKIVFDVAEIPLPYNGILGRPALAKFMAASHYAYNILKMSGPMTIITVPSDKKEEDDDHDEDDESSEHEFQKAMEAMCVDGGASLHTSHR